MTLTTTLEGFVQNIRAAISNFFTSVFPNALQAFTTFIQKNTGISPAGLHHFLRRTGIILLALLFLFVLQRLYRLWLPGHFARRYGISRLPKHIVIKRRFALPMTRNTYVLRFPSWRYANSNGTRDQRRKGNRINWKSSCLLIDSYQIFMKNPLQMVRLVRRLREQGIEIAPCSQEIEKQHKLHKSQTSYRSGSSAELHSRFQDDPFEFEEYCATLFRAMGKKAQTTRRTNDGGYDVIVSDSNGQHGIVECKCYAPDSKIGRPMLQKLVGACMAYPTRLDYLIFVTTSDFSEEAKTFAHDFQQRERISFGLINGPALEELSEKYLSDPSLSKKKDARSSDDWKQWQLSTSDLKDRIPADLFDRL